MKKNRLQILILVLVVSQLISILRISDLKRQIENTKGEMHHLNNIIRDDMDSIYSNVDEMLKQKANLIESATTEIGALNAEELTVPITFTLTPKEVTEHTGVSLDFQGELFPMERSDTTFTATVSRNVFGDALPKIVIAENDIKKTVEDDRVFIWSIKDSFFPIIYPSFMGQEGFYGEIYTIEGDIQVETKEVESTVKYTEMRIVIKVDDKLISDKVIPNEMLNSGYKVNKKIPLSNEETCLVTLVARDSMGLEHHYIVGSWEAGSELQRDRGFKDEHIYSADGKLLWKPGY